MKEGRTAIMCSSNNQTSCTASAWTAGWLIWVDTNGNGTLDATEITRVNESLKGTIAVTAANTTLSFTPTGFTMTPGTLKICDNRTGNLGKQLRILTGGSMSLTTQIACP